MYVCKVIQVKICETVPFYFTTLNATTCIIVPLLFKSNDTFEGTSNQKTFDYCDRNIHANTCISKIMKSTLIQHESVVHSLSSHRILTLCH